jgi:hypothetical protein
MFDQEDRGDTATHVDVGGRDNRAAGRDYVEHQHITHPKWTPPSTAKLTPCPSCCNPHVSPHADTCVVCGYSFVRIASLRRGSLLARYLYPPIALMLFVLLRNLEAMKPWALLDSLEKLEQAAGWSLASVCLLITVIAWAEWGTRRWRRKVM